MRCTSYLVELALLVNINVTMNIRIYLLLFTVLLVFCTTIHYVKCIILTCLYCVKIQFSLCPPKCTRYSWLIKYYLFINNGILVLFSSYSQSLTFRSFVLNLNMLQKPLRIIQVHCTSIKYYCGKDMLNRF